MMEVHKIILSSDCKNYKRCHSPGSTRFMISVKFMKSVNKNPDESMVSVKDMLFGFCLCGSIIGPRP